jgi:Skp family chaperone for outer membrane proteins
MSADQRSAAEQSLRDGQRELDEKVSEFQDDLTARQNQVMSKLSSMLSQQVGLYAQAHHFDLVLASSVIWHNAAIDITQPVLAALQTQGGGTAPALR